MLRTRVAPALLALALAAVPTTSHASGFAIFEQGARGMGFAGAFTSQSDPTSIFHNAAGIAFVKGTQISFGGTLIAPTSDFVGANPFPGEAVTETGDAGVIVPPTFDLTHQFSDRLVVGVGLHVPYGLRTRWKNRETTYSGRFISKRAQVQALSLNPSVAWKVADRFAVGGGLDIRLSTLELDRNVGIINPFTLSAVDVAAVELKGDRATDFGFNLGVLARPSDHLSLGAAYRHKVKQAFTGTADFNRLSTGNSQLDALVALTIPAGPVGVATEIEFPSLLSVGASYEWNEWTVAGQVDFHNWSSFDQLPLEFEGRPDLSSVVEENYSNSRIYRLGLERKVGERWALRGGYYYDETPAPAESVSPLLPDADRHGIALGFGFKSGHWSVDVANWYLIFKERSTEGVNRDNYNGTYDNGAELFAVTVGYGF